MKDNNIKIRKIHLDTILKILVELYDQGVDYIDIVGEINDVQDTIGISFCEEYMSKDMKENFDDMTTDLPDDDDEPIFLKDDEDLNQLI